MGVRISKLLFPHLVSREELVPPPESPELLQLRQEHAALQLRYQELLQARIAPTESIELDESRITMFVDKLMADPNVNIGLVPDALERRVYERIVRMALSSMLRILCSSKMEILGHAVGVQMRPTAAAVPEITVSVPVPPSPSRSLLENATQKVSSVVEGVTDIIIPKDRKHRHRRHSSSSKVLEKEKSNQYGSISSVVPSFAT